MIHVKVFPIDTYFLFMCPSHPEWCAKLSYQYYFYFSLYCSNFYFTKDGFFGSFFVILGFPCDSAGKESTCNAGDLSLIPGLGRSLREVKGYPLQYSGLENSMDCVVHGVTRRHNWVTFTSLLVIWYIVCILLYFRLWLFTI